MTINGISITKAQDLSNVSLQALTQSMNHTKPRIQGYQNVERNYLVLLRDVMMVDGIHGEISLYDGGYIVFKFLNTHSKKNNYTVVDVFEGIFHFQSVVPSQTTSLPVSTFYNLPALDALSCIIGSRIEDNLISQQKSKEKKEIDNFTIGGKAGVHTQMNENAYARDFLTIEIEKEIDIQNANTRKEIKCFFDSFMETLTLKQKEALLLRRNDYTLAEIAKMVSVPASVSSIEERLDRAYYKMTKKWNQLHPNDKVPEFPSPDAKKKKK